MRDVKASEFGFAVSLASQQNIIKEMTAAWRCNTLNALSSLVVVVFVLFPFATPNRFTLSRHLLYRFWLLAFFGDADAGDDVRSRCNACCCLETAVWPGDTHVACRCIVDLRRLT